MSFIPGFQVTNYLGNMNLFVIRETSSVREFGGISGFMHKFVAEVLALMRAHVAALGGNALLAFNLNQCVLLDNPNRNQAQCLINITGDAVRLEPEKLAAASSGSCNGVNGVGVPKTVFVGGKSASPQSPNLRREPPVKEEPPTTTTAGAGGNDPVGGTGKENRLLSGRTTARIKEDNYENDDDNYHDDNNIIFCCIFCIFYKAE